MAGMFITQALSPSLQMAWTDALNQPHPDGPCSTSGKRMLGRPAQKCSLPRGCTQAALPTLLAFLAQHSESHPAGKLRGGWKSLHLFYFPANISSAVSLLSTKQENERCWQSLGASLGALPSPHTVFPQPALKDHPSHPLLSPSPSPKVWRDCLKNSLISPVWKEGWQETCPIWRCVFQNQDTGRRGSGGDGGQQGDNDKCQGRSSASRGKVWRWGGCSPGIPSAQGPGATP